MFADEDDPTEGAAPAAPICAEPQAGQETPEPPAEPETEPEQPAPAEPEAQTEE